MALSTNVAGNIARLVGTNASDVQALQTSADWSRRFTAAQLKLALEILNIFSGQSLVTYGIKSVVADRIVMLIKKLDPATQSQEFPQLSSLPVPPFANIEGRVSEMVKRAEASRNAKRARKQAQITANASSPAAHFSSAAAAASIVVQARALMAQRERQEEQQRQQQHQNNILRQQQRQKQQQQQRIANAIAQQSSAEQQRLHALTASGNPPSRKYSSSSNSSKRKSSSVPNHEKERKRPSTSTTPSTHSQPNPVTPTRSPINSPNSSTAASAASAKKSFFDSRPYALPQSATSASSSYNGVGATSSRAFLASSSTVEHRSNGEAKEEPVFLTQANANMTEAEEASMATMRSRGLPFVESLLCLRQYDGDLGRAFSEVMDILREREDNQFADQASKESELMNVQERAKRDREMEMRCAYTDVVSDGMFAESILLRDVAALKAAVSLGNEVCVLDDEDDDGGACDTRTLGIRLLVMEQRTKTWFGAKSVAPFFMEFAQDICARLAGSKGSIGGASSRGRPSVEALLRQVVNELEVIIFSMPRKEGGMPIPLLDALDRTLVAGGRRSMGGAGDRGREKGVGLIGNSAGAVSDDEDEEVTLVQSSSISPKRATASVTPRSDVQSPTAGADVIDLC